MTPQEQLVHDLRVGAKEPCDGCCYGETMLQAVDEIADLRKANTLLHGLLTNRDAEIERLGAERDQFERDAGRLRLAAYEATTNGRWTEGEQCGEWAISHEVYETLHDAIADEQDAQPTASPKCPGCGAALASYCPTCQRLLES